MIEIEIERTKFGCFCLLYDNVIVEEELKVTEGLMI